MAGSRRSIFTRDWSGSGAKYIYSGSDVALASPVRRMASADPRTMEGGESRLQPQAHGSIVLVCLRGRAPGAQGRNGIRHLCSADVPFLAMIKSVSSDSIKFIKTRMGTYTPRTSELPL
jgi:hypothetical protein